MISHSLVSPFQVNTDCSRARCSVVVFPSFFPVEVVPFFARVQGPWGHSQPPSCCLCQQNSALSYLPAQLACLVLTHRDRNAPPGETQVPSRMLLMGLLTTSAPNRRLKLKNLRASTFHLLCEYHHLSPNPFSFFGEKICLNFFFVS